MATPISVAPRPFENIGLSISGGGYRAAAFGLGCLAYLHHLRWRGDHLLHRVRFLTSTSGGSFPAMLYAANLYSGKEKPFEATYRFLYQVLLREELLTIAMRILEDREKQYWGPHGKYPLKERNLINAFSVVYDEHLFSKQCFGVFYGNHEVHLKEVCFNAAEMINGRTFRFQYEAKNRCELIGNYYLKIQPDVQSARSIRLGDVLAASSCFPGGFEPLIYPRDFAASPEDFITFRQEVRMAPHHDFEAQAIPFNAPFPLMDGGITDNQGIESLRLADERRRKQSDATHQAFDLMLVCDVANYYSEPYRVPEQGTGGWSGLKMKWLFNARIYAGILLLIATYTGLKVFQQHSELDLTTFSLLWGCIVVQSISILTLLGLGYGYHWYRGEKQSLQKNLGNLLFEKGLLVLVKYLSAQRLGVVRLMVQNRIQSVMRILYSVMLLQIRRVNYDFLFGMPHWKGRVKTINIYKLSTENVSVYRRTMNKFMHEEGFAQGKLLDQQVSMLEPSQRLKEVAETARTMDTTLWFTPENREQQTGEKLIASGQFTTCHTLLEYTYTLLNDPRQSAHHEELKKLAKVLEADWSRFNENPVWLVEFFNTSTP